MQLANRPDIRDLFALFPPDEYLRAYEFVEADRLPEPERSLLAHEHHMTVTVEQHFGSLVDVRVLEHKLEGDSYARKILLPLQSDGRIVLFGLVRIHLQFCSQQVRDEILARDKPLGRILIEHDVLRRIEPTAYLRVIPGPEMLTWFGLAKPEPCYGRLAIIHCDHQPAIELLEIVRPEPKPLQ
jgi:chorismate-pyruvate lyase